MPAIERLKFSIPISITIDAPIDIVWSALTDINSYENILSSVAASYPIDDPVYKLRSSFLSSVSSANEANDKTTTGVPSEHSNSSHTKPPDSSNRNTPRKLRPTRAELGSKWRIKRISVLENQTYSANVTVTQFSEEKNRRTMTFSTHEMLGAACSLKLRVESIPVKASSQNNINNEGGNGSSNGIIAQNADAYLECKHDDVESPPSEETAQHQNQRAVETSNSKQPSSTCQVTVTMSMIPYHFFVKLLGIMCCLCLLKYRARIAMECDLEDLITHCEQVYQDQQKQKDAPSVDAGHAEHSNEVHVAGEEKVSVTDHAGVCAPI